MLHNGEMGSVNPSRLVAAACVVLLHFCGLMLFKLNKPSRMFDSQPIEVTLVQSPQLTPRQPVPPAEPVLPSQVMEVLMPEVEVQRSPSMFAQVAAPQMELVDITKSSDVSVAPAQAVAMVQTLETQCPVHPAPMYPSQAKRLREQGSVVLGIELDEVGKVVAVQVTRSSGSHRLDEAGLTALRNWQCRPALRDGQPVRARVHHEFEFVLNTR